MSAKERRWLKRHGNLNGYKSKQEKLTEKHDKRFIVKRLTMKYDVICTTEPRGDHGLEGFCLGCYYQAEVDNHRVRLFIPSLSGEWQAVGSVTHGIFRKYFDILPEGNDLKLVPAKLDKVVGVIIGNDSTGEVVDVKGFKRRPCSKCGEGLGFTESDPCERCQGEDAST